MLVKDCFIDDRVKGKTTIPTTEKTLLVLIVEDNRDAADALDLLVEAIGHQVASDVTKQRAIATGRYRSRTPEGF